LRVTTTKEYNLIGFNEKKNETSLTMKARLSRYQLIKFIVFSELKISNNEEFNVLLTVYRDVSVQ